MKTLAFIFKLSLVLAALQARGQVVINEIFYHAPDDIADLQWVELYNTSDQAVNLSGWRLSKAAIKEPTSTIHREDLPRVMENWTRDMAAGQPYEDEMRLRHADGEYRWFLVTYRAAAR
jgi:PAS domain-containing protein